MKLTGTARGESLPKILEDAEWQAVAFFGSGSYHGMSIEKVTAHTEDYPNGKTAITFTAEFECELGYPAPITIQEGE